MPYDEELRFAHTVRLCPLSFGNLEVQNPHGLPRIFAFFLQLAGEFEATR